VTPVLEPAKHSFDEVAQPVSLAIARMNSLRMGLFGMTRIAPRSVRKRRRSSLS
jgi:hypothetical protein